MSSIFDNKLFLMNMVQNILQYSPDSLHQDLKVRYQFLHLPLLDLYFCSLQPRLLRLKLLSFLHYHLIPEKGSVKNREKIHQKRTEKDALLGLHRKRDSVTLNVSERKDFVEREKNLKDLEKKLKATLDNQRKQQNYRDSQKRGIESLESETRKEIKTVTYNKELRHSP